MLKLIWAANLVLLYSSLSCYSAAWLWNKPLTNQHFIKKGRNQESVLRVTVASELQTHLLAVILLFHRNTNIVNKWTYSWLSLIFCKKWANKGFNGLYTSCWSWDLNLQPSVHTSSGLPPIPVSPVCFSLWFKSSIVSSSLRPKVSDDITIQILSPFSIN